MDIETTICDYLGIDLCKVFGLNYFLVKRNPLKIKEEKRYLCTQLNKIRDELDTQGLEEWFKSPNTYFNGKSPSSLFENREYDFNIEDDGPEKILLDYLKEQKERVEIKKNSLKEKIKKSFPREVENRNGQIFKDDRGIISNISKRIP